MKLNKRALVCVSVSLPLAATLACWAWSYFSSIGCDLQSTRNSVCRVEMLNGVLAVQRVKLIGAMAQPLVGVTIAPRTGTWPRGSVSALKPPQPRLRNGFGFGFRRFDVGDARSGIKESVYAVPMWPIAMVISWVLWAALGRRTALIGLTCHKCGYDLRATPDKCPECGTDAPQKQRVESLT
jgi:hypothetical protein